MKFVKKITALFLAVTMVMAMGITASAAGNNTDGWTISVMAGDTHTYAVYQVLTGSLAADGTLGNLAAGSNFDSSKKVNDAVTAIQAQANNGDQAIANVVASYVNFSGTAYASDLSTSKSLTGVPSGYYLIKDANTLTGDDAYSTYIVKVVGDTEVARKADTPSFQKKIKDVNDSDATVTANTDWNDSADYDIGDEVPFQLKATLPSNYSSYTKYYLEFQDQMEGGLTFTKSSVVVKIGDKTLSEGTDYTILTSASIYDETNGKVKSGSGFTIKIADVKTANPAATKDSVVTVEYTAKLNEKAVIGSTGNVNEAKLKYSNNPNQSGDGENGPTGETPWDYVIVFTYKVDISKVSNEIDEQTKKNTPLTGAGFTLYKVDAASGKTKIKEWTMSADQAGTEFTVSGLDDGTYILSETTTPAGYNTMADVTFTIYATHDVKWTTKDRTGVITDFSGTDKNTGVGKVEFTATPATGSVAATVVNQKGSNLPSTGGMGTTILYVAGIALIVVAGVVVIARKRNA